MAARLEALRYEPDLVRATTSEFHSWRILISLDECELA
jgi:hypothetical protein